MRVTQSMLTNNMLRNLSASFQRMGKYQDQLATGKKITRPSDDPVVAMRGMGYRTDLGMIKQFQRNIGEVHNWLDSTDSALDQATNVLQRIRELVVQASNGVNTKDELNNIAMEISQLREQLIDIGNSKVGGRYIFNGVNTMTPPLDKSNPSDPASGGINNDPFLIEVFDGVKMQANTDGQKIFGDNSGTGGTNLFGDLEDLLLDLTSGAGAPGNSISSYLDKIQNNINNVLAVRADIGARQNRVELMESRLEQQEVFASRILSENEDADIERVITDLKMQESVHRAALGVGARIIQPTLLDFLR
jgi:flagellar hook-associated protein 3 FlgL